MRKGKNGRLIITYKQKYRLFWVSELIFVDID